MTTERLRASPLPRALSDVVVDVADLVQKEMRLARAEIAEKLSNKLRAGAWMLISAAMALGAFLMLIEGLALWISTFGTSLYASHWIIGVALALMSALAYFAGRAGARESLAPERTIHQVNRDMTETKERLR
jgi:Putative Actinobacterial Holin-X, holin superfamily III